MKWKFCWHDYQALGDEMSAYPLGYEYRVCMKCYRAEIRGWDMKWETLAETKRWYDEALAKKSAEAERRKLAIDFLKDVK